MKTNLADIPEEIIDIIVSEYLRGRDRRDFLNVTKKEWMVKLRKRCIYYNFKLHYSELFCGDRTFRERILGSIIQSSKQIALCLPARKLLQIPEDLQIHQITLSNDNFADRFIHRLDGVSRIRNIFLSENSLPYLPNLVSATNIMASELRDVRDLSHLQRLELNGCTSLKEISPLSNIADLTLISCPNIKSISSLGLQQRLRLIDCPGIKSVSSLHSVRQLLLRNCEGIKDFAPLAQIHDLSIEHCQHFKTVQTIAGAHYRLKLVSEQSLEGLDSLANIPHLHLEVDRFIALPVLHQTKSIFLKGRLQLPSLETLRSVSQITLHLTNTPSSYNNHHNTSRTNSINSQSISLMDIATVATEASFQGNHALWDCSSPRSLAEDYNDSDNNNRIRLKKLSFHSFFSLEHLSQLPAITRSLTHLSFTAFAAIEELLENQLTCFTALRCLQIEKCPTLLALPQTCRQLPEVVIRFCPRLQSIEGLGENLFVQIESCPRLRDAAVLRGVPRVSLIHCEAIENVQVLEREVPRLLVSRCHRHSRR